MDNNSTTEEDNLDEDQDLDSTEDENGEQADDLETSDDSEEDSGDDDESETEEADTEDSDTVEVDDDLDEWAEKTGRSVPTTDAERKLLQEVRDGQREFTRQQQAKKENASKLNEGIDAAKPEEDKSKTDKADPLEARLDRQERQLNEERALRLRGEFLSNPEVTDDEVTAMGEILKEKVEKAATAKAKQEAFDYWTNPAHMEDWHDLAKIRVAKNAGSTGEDKAAIEAEAAKKERERIAKESKANGSNRNASTTRTGEKTEEEKRLERFQHWD